MHVYACVCLLVYVNLHTFVIVYLLLSLLADLRVFFVHVYLNECIWEHVLECE